MPIKNQDNNQWYFGKHLNVAYEVFSTMSAINNVSADTIKRMNELVSNSSHEEQEAIAPVIEEVTQAMEQLFVLEGEAVDHTVSVAQKKAEHMEKTVNPFKDAAKKGQEWQDRQNEAREKGAFVLKGEPIDHTVSAAQKKANHLERSFFLVGTVNDHVDQLQINTQRNIEKAQIRWGNKTLFEKIMVIVDSFVSKVHSIIKNITQTLNNIFSDHKGKHSTTFKPVLEEMTSKMQHKENFKPTLDALKMKSEEEGARLLSKGNASKHPAPQGETNTKKYKNVMGDINKAGINDEGHSSNLKSTLRTPKP